MLALTLNNLQQQSTNNNQEQSMFMKMTGEGMMILQTAACLHCALHASAAVCWTTSIYSSKD